MAAIWAAAVNAAWDAVKTTLGFGCTRANYFHDLEDNLRVLMNQMGILKRQKEQVEARVRHERTPYLVEAHRVTEWLTRVNQLQEEAGNTVQEAQDEIQHKHLRFFCPRNFCDHERAGKRVIEKQRVMADAIEKGNFDVVVERNYNLLTKIPMEPTIGLDSISADVWNLVDDPDVKVIGLYGMGGVGKTTLLKTIHNMFCDKRHDFDLVIWVDVSKERSYVRQIQNVIRGKLEIPDGRQWRAKSQGDRASEIFAFLQMKKFVLLLDDITREFKLSEVGVPFDGNSNGSKIIFTTRSIEVCLGMKADEIVRMECLPPEEALQLFYSCLGNAVLDANPSIRQLGETVAIFCNGLPLALTVTARAMAPHNPCYWAAIIKDLERQWPKLSNVEDQLFRVLAISYEGLPDQSAKDCFLYFSVFPDVHNIKEEEVIQLWRGEGFLGSFDTSSPGTVRMRGKQIVATLKSASLLEDDDSEGYVKMHDMIHATTRWLACHHHQENRSEIGDKVLVVHPVPNIGTRNCSLVADKVFINAVEVQSRDLDFTSLPNLHTLFVKELYHDELPFMSSFWRHAKALRVLNLSGNNNVLSHLSEEIGWLENLCYLNVSNTEIRLPFHVELLKKLEILIQDNTWFTLSSIPKGLIRNLESLRVFRMVSDFAPGEDNLSFETEILEELLSLKHLDEIAIRLTSSTGVQKLLGSPELLEKITELVLTDRSIHFDSAASPISEFSTAVMRRVERLDFWNCPSLRKVELGTSLYLLQVVRIWKCDIRDVRCLKFASLLQTLAIFECRELRMILADDDAGSSGDVYGADIFPELRNLFLTDIPKMERICSGVAKFPSLKKLHVDNCPYLRRLPFDANSAKKLVEIIGEKSWWDKLQWASEACREAFLRKYDSDPRGRRYYLKWNDKGSWRNLW